MKRIFNLALVGLWLALGSFQAQSALTTNYWVQNVNFSLTAYVQYGNLVVVGTIPTKQIISFLSGLTNGNTIVSSSNSVTTLTNSNGSTNVTVSVANVDFLPTGTFFPGGIVITNDYVVTLGTTNYINHTNFDNDIILTRTSTNPPTYSFTNSFTIPTNQTAYFFPEIPADYLTAALDTNLTVLGETNVYDISGSTNYQYTYSTTNPITLAYGSLPVFPKNSKLIYVTPVVAGFLYTNTYTIIDHGVPVTTNVSTVATSNLTSSFMVRYSNGNNVSNCDVTSFFAAYDSIVVENNQIYNEPPVVYNQPGVNVPRYMLNCILFSTGTPNFNPQNYCSFCGFETQTRGKIPSLGYAVDGGVIKQRRLTGGGSGILTGNFPPKYNFSSANTALSGSITFSGGHLETQAP